MHSTKCRFWSSKLRGLVRLQLISENYSRCLSIFRVFTQPGSNSEELSVSKCLPGYPRKRTSLDAVGMSQRCQEETSPIFAAPYVSLFLSLSCGHKRGQ